MSREKNLVIKVDANTKPLRDKFDRVKQETAGLEDTLSSVAKKSAIAFTGLSVGLGVIVSRFVDFETALVGVGKTADLSGEELRTFGVDIRVLSNEIGVSTTELLNLAQAAGQLGVKGSANLALFTATVAKLGTASNLAGEEAATSLARILNVTGENITNVEDLASVIVSLGNNFAASEREITRVANEVARSTSQFNVSSAEAAAFGAALRSIGVQAELGGSVIGKAFRTIDAVIRDGGEEFTNLQILTGETGEVLRKTFAEDSVEVFQLFIEGLGRVARSGGSVAAELEKFSLRGDEVLKILPVLANTSGELGRALGLANKELANATALELEFLRQTDTLAFSQRRLTIGIDNFASSLGEKLRPATVAIFNALGQLVDRLNSLSESTKTNIAAVLTFITSFAGVALVISTVGFAVIKLRGLLIGLAATFTSVGVTARLAWASATLGLSLIIPAIAALVVKLGGLENALTAVGSVFTFVSNQIQIGINKVRILFLQLENAIDGLARKFPVLAGAISTTLSAIVAPLNLIINGVTNLGNLFTTVFEQGKVAIDSVRQVFTDLGREIDSLLNKFPKFTEAAKSAVDSFVAPIKIGVEAITTLGNVFNEEASKLDERVEKLKANNQELNESFTTIFRRDQEVVDSESADSTVSAQETDDTSIEEEIQRKLEEEARKEAALREQQENFRTERQLIEDEIRATEAEEEQRREELGLEEGEEKFDLELETLSERLSRLRDERLKFLSDEEKDLEKSLRKKAELEKKADQELIKQKQATNKLIADSALSLADSLVKEGTGAAKALFLARKAFAIGETLINAQQAASLAIATVPPPAGEAIAAQRIAQGAISAAFIAAQAVTGFQRGGLVGQGGSFSADRHLIMARDNELIAPPNSFDEVIEGVARQRGFTKNEDFATPDGEGGQNGNEVTVMIDLSDSAAELITAQQFENSSLGVDRS